jgi:transcriptional regulator with XRE-family HTH domain
MDVRDNSGDFAENLALVMSRLNLSRVELAHRVGVDKSVVRRWVLGDTRPSEINLSMLTELASARIQGFTRDCWFKSSDELTGMLARDSQSMSGAAAVEAIFPHFGPKLRESLNPGLQRYGGLWIEVCVVAGPDGSHSLFCSGGMIADNAGQLWLYSSDGASGMRTGNGPAFVSEDKLWILLDEQGGRNDLCAILLNGSGGQQAVILDGIYMVRSFMSGAPVAGRVRFFRLADLPTDRQRAENLYRAICDRSGELSRSNFASKLPPEIATLLLGESNGSKPRRPHVMPVELSDSLATLTMAADILADGRLKRRHLLNAIKSYFSDILT